MRCIARYPITVERSLPKGTRYFAIKVFLLRLMGTAVHVAALSFRHCLKREHVDHARQTSAGFGLGLDASVADA
jgi:hypothetical protein